MKCFSRTTCRFLIVAMSSVAWMTAAEKGRPLILNCRSPMIFLASALLLSTLLFATGADESNGSERTCTHAIPDLSSFATWTSDLRAASQQANLPSAGDGGCDTGTSPPRKVLLVGIDGLRTSALMLPLPTFRRLERMGTYSYWAHVQSETSTVSGPGWTSLFTGVQAGKHKVNGNGDLTDISEDYPTVFKAFKDQYPARKVAASVSWHPLIDSIIDHQDPDALDARYKAENDEAMSEKAQQWILSKEYDFIFVDYDDVDQAGHSKKFDPYLPQYRAAVQKTDALVGTLLDAVLSVSKDEEWLVVVTSDHGGNKRDHGKKIEYNLRVPLLVASNSPRVMIGHVSVDDPGSQLDVLPTIMHFVDGGSCVDSPYRFKVFSAFRSCDWVADSSTAVRCAYRGVSSTCPKTCGSCNECMDSSSQFKLRQFENGPTQKRKCSWTKSDAAARCNIDGMRDTCRKTCDGCHPSYNVDGQVFGFIDYQRAKCVPNPLECSCDGTNQDDYRGTIATTSSGRTCQRWEKQSPHSHTRTPEGYPSSGLEENYCRNPDNESSAWCYTTDSDKRWESCDVPSCTVE